MLNSVVNEDDFKYYMQDAEKNYFGARYSYNELLMNEMVPFKFKTIIERYLVKNIDKDTTLESHLYHLCLDDFETRTYRQLKARIRVSERKRSLFGRKGNAGFREKVYKIQELAVMTAAEKEEKEMIIRELILPKLALFAFTV